MERESRRLRGARPSGVASQLRPLAFGRSDGRQEEAVVHDPATVGHFDAGLPGGRAAWQCGARTCQRRLSRASGTTRMKVSLPLATSGNARTRSTGSRSTTSNQARERTGSRSRGPSRGMHGAAEATGCPDGVVHEPPTKVVSTLRPCATTSTGGTSANGSGVAGRASVTAPRPKPSATQQPTPAAARRAFAP